MNKELEAKRQPKLDSYRRGFLVKLATGAGALGAAWWLRPVKLWGSGGDPATADTSKGGDPATADTPKGDESPVQHPVDPAVRRFLGELREGTTIDGRWTIDRVQGPRFGAIGVRMRSADGDVLQVDVLRRDDSIDGPPPIFTTDSLALHLSNRGKGGLRTDEDQGRAVIAFGRELALRERAGHRAPQLLTFDERRARHPLGEYSIA